MYISGKSYLAKLTNGNLSNWLTIDAPGKPVNAASYRYEKVMTGDKKTYNGLLRETHPT